MFTFLEPYLAEVKVVGIAVVILIISALWITEKEYKHKYEAELQTNAALAQRIAQSDSALKTCSDDVQKISDESETKLKAAQAATDQAVTEAKKYKSYANSLLAAVPSVPSDPDQCKSTLVLFNTYLTNLKGQK